MRIPDDEGYVKNAGRRKMGISKHRGKNDHRIWQSAVNACYIVPLLVKQAVNV